MAGHFVVQPTTSAAENFYVRGLEPRFLFEFPIHSLLGSLSYFDATLRKLPSVLFDALPPKNLIPSVAQHDCNVWAIAVAVNHGDHP